MKRYPAYKDSGVEWLGEVPEGWTIRRFKEFLQEREERSLTGSEPLLSVSAYTGVTRRADNLEAGEHLSRAETLEGYKVCYSGDLVMNIMLAWNRAQGIAPTDGIVSPSYAVFFHDMTIESRFLEYLIRSDGYCEYFKSFSAGVIDSRLRLYPDKFRALAAICPPLPEQRAIACFLDRETGKIDALIAEQRRLIALLAEKRQATISHAVTRGLNPDAKLKPSGVEWLGDVPEGWDVVPTGYRYEVQLGRMLNEGRAFGDYMRPYLRVLDVQWGHINTEDLPFMDFPPDAQKRYRLLTGDLLVNEGGSYVGRSAIWHGDIDEVYYQKALHRLRPRDNNRDKTGFFYYVMDMATRRNVFVANANQTTIDHLTAEQLRAHKFAFPPMIEQVAIFNWLSDEIPKLDTLTETATRAITLLQERRAALISAAVTGKIDVRDLVPAEAA